MPRGADRREELDVYGLDPERCDRAHEEEWGSESPAGLVADS